MTTDPDIQRPTRSSATPARLAVIGIGSPLAGDDAVGLVAVDRLRTRWSGHDAVLLETLEGDLFAVSELLELAERFLFVDAIAGETPGVIEVQGATCRAFAPSFHQTDIGAVMASLEAVGLVQPFPEWELWGVVIDPPRELREGLCPEVGDALERLLPRLSERIRSLVGAPGREKVIPVTPR